MMNILVCIKQVPDLERVVFPDPVPGHSIDWEWDPADGRLNSYDAYALEAALRLRETCGASRIDALTVGAHGADAVLRRAIGMGTDHGILIPRVGQAFPSPFTIGGLIAAYAQDKAYDLILCGAMSEDLMQGQVGAVIAGLLGWPCLTAVHTLDAGAGSGKLRCEREVEGGRSEILEVALPALVSIQSGAHPPRYPALGKLLRANKQPLEVVAPDALAPMAQRQRVANTRRPGRARKGIFLQGGAAEKAHQLASLLRSRGLV